MATPYTAKEETLPALRAPERTCLEISFDQLCISSLGCISSLRCISSVGCISSFGRLPAGFPHHAERGDAAEEEVA